MAAPYDLVNMPVPSAYQMDGPIAGMVAAQQLGNWNDAQSRAFRDSDLSYAGNLNTYQNAIADNPVKAMDRLNALSQGQDLQSSWQSGQMGQMQSTARDLAIQKALSGKTETQLQEISGKAAWARSASQSMGTAPTNPMEAAQKKEMYENYILPAAKAVGADAGLPQEYTPQVHAMLAQRGLAAESVSKTLDALTLEREKSRSAAEVANIHGEWAVKAAAAQGERAAALQFGGLPEARKIEADARAEMQDDPAHGLNAGTVSKLRSVYEELYQQKDQAMISAQRTTDITQATLMQGNPDKYKELMSSVGLPANATPAQYAEANIKKKFNDQSAAFLKDRYGSNTPVHTGNGDVPLGKFVVGSDATVASQVVRRDMSNPRVIPTTPNRPSNVPPDWVYGPNPNGKPGNGWMPPQYAPKQPKDW